MMRVLLGIAVVTALIVGLLGIGPSLHAPAHASGACTVSNAELPPDQEEQNLLNEINRYRSSPYVWSNTLSRAAVWQAKDMAANDYVGHTDTLGRTFPTRLTDCGHSPTIPAGENVTAGRTQYYGDTNTVSYWFFTTADFHNLVGAEFTHAGIAHVYNALSTQKNYWVLVVGVEGSAGPTPTPWPTPTNVVPTATPLPPPTTTPAPRLRLLDCRVLDGTVPGPFTLDCLAP